MKKDSRLKAPTDDFEASEQMRAKRLAALSEDRTFYQETEKMRRALVELRSRNQDAVALFFKRFSYLFIYRSEKLKRLLRLVGDENAVAVFRDYVRYAARFQVRMTPYKDTFRVTPIAPFKSKYHVEIINGQLKSASKQVREEKEPVFEDLYADDTLAPPKAVTDFLAAGHGRFVRIDDSGGSSMMAELESFAYSADALTFVVHHGAHHTYIYCLVGEAVATDTTWRNAGKVITALQREYYGRAKAGRPTNLARLKQAVALREEDGRPLKEKAFELGPSNSKLESRQQYLSRIGKKVRPPRRLK